MFQALVKHGPHVAVVQGIKNHLPVPAVLYQLGLAQRVQLMGNGRFGHSQKDGYVAYTKFPMKKAGKYSNPGRIAEYLKEIRQIKQALLFRQLFPDTVNLVLMQYRTGVLFHIVCFCPSHTTSFLVH
jgi:hypothetical protein